MKRFFLTASGLLAMSCLFITSCSSDSEENSGGGPPPVINPCNGTPGPKFLAAKAVIQANCVSCHQPGGQQPNPNFSTDCGIVNQAARIKVRAVDQGTMPPTGPLSQADKDLISAWVNAGGKITD